MTTDEAVSRDGLAANTPAVAEWVFKALYRVWINNVWKRTVPSRLPVVQNTKDAERPAIFDVLLDVSVRLCSVHGSAYALVDEAWVLVDGVRE